MNRKTSFIIAGTLVLLLSVLGLFAFTDIEINKPKYSYLEQIRQNNELVVLTRNAPTTYYEGKHGPDGVEHDLIKQFATHLNVNYRVVVKDNTADIIRALANDEGHIAAAGLTQTENRAKDFLFGPSYQPVEQQVVCRRGMDMPDSIEELVGVDLWVTAGASYVETLNKYKTQVAELSWQESSNLDTEGLLEKVWLKEIECTVADSNIVDINRRYYPELLIAFNLSEAENISWLMQKSALGLNNEVKNWFGHLVRKGELASILNKHYGFVELFDYVDLSRFNRRIKKRLPRYTEHFKQAANEFDLPWSLLAAQSYQESHWRAKAKSPTGVRGIMMLTLVTAKEMGVDSRLNPQQSIKGGAKYLRHLMNRLPEEILEPDRTWFALAAYNVGMGHIYDARQLAREQGKDPNKWHDLETVLPLLSQKKYYKKLKYGYARGKEPVRYVQRIRNFQNILERELVVAEEKKLKAFKAELKITTN